MTPQIRMASKAFLIVSVLFCTGCPGPGVWYAPRRNGVLLADGNWINVKNHLRIELEQNVHATVVAYPDDHDTRLSFHMDIPKGSWAQFASNAIMLTRTDTYETRRVVIDHMDDRCFVDQNGEIQEEPPRHELDRIRKYMTLGHRARLEDFRPKQFVLEMPPLTVDGKVFYIPPITFTQHRGIAFEIEIM